MLPQYQGNGIGKRIMDDVITYIEENVASGSFVGLMAAKGVSGFYGKYGFRERPSDGPGMFRIM